MLGLRERMDLDLEARMMGETLILNRSFDPLYGDYIELNDLNEPLELRRNRNDDLEPTIEEADVVNELMMDLVKTRKFYNSIMKDKIEYEGKNVVKTFMNVPVFVGNFCVVTNFAVMENMDIYRDKDMGDVIIGEPFCKVSCVEARSPVDLEFLDAEGARGLIGVLRFCLCHLSQLLCLSHNSDTAPEGVSSCTDASGSQPRSILKKHRIPPAKSDSLKKVEDTLLRLIRSSLRTTNRVDSSSSSKAYEKLNSLFSVCMKCTVPDLAFIVSSRPFPPKGSYPMIEVEKKNHLCSALVQIVGMSCVRSDTHSALKFVNWYKLNEKTFNLQLLKTAWFSKPCQDEKSNELLIRDLGPLWDYSRHSSQCHDRPDQLGLGIERHRHWHYNRYADADLQVVRTLAEVTSAVLQVSAQDELNGISHSYQKLKTFYKGILDLRPEYIRDEKIFNSYKDAKTLMQAIENIFRGNTATKKTQNNLLKQQYENFVASSTEVIEQTYERLQKLISQLEMHGEVIPQEDIN
ncbi:hypothetical protein Tco_0992451 [Tanacetum coccineum]|uniref:Uncharacterized protein n=1 Tax=Tanacetum coccineum TaxID=301880 RepID=A0ABQ5F3M7_9ASTR